MKKKQIIVNVIILIAYISLQVFLILYHEAWRDESQAWILAKNSSFAELLGLCASEGHPCLWFFVLKICSLCGLSFYNLSIISVITMAVASFLFLWKAPFSVFSKVCILLSPLFFYYNPVISRIYAVLMLLIVLLCILWPKRREQPILYGIVIAFLFQSHILIAGLAIGCLLEMAIHFKELLKKKKNIIGFIIPVVSLFCMVLELKQTDKSETYIHVNLEYILSRFRIMNLMSGIYSVTKRFDSGLSFIGIVFLLLCVGLVVYYVLYVAKDSQFRKTGMDIGIVFLCASVVYWGIIVFVRIAAHVQMAVVFWMILLFFVWTVISTLKDMKTELDKNDAKSDLPKDKEQKGVKRFLLNNIYELLFLVCCLLAIPQSAWIDPVADVTGQFSGSLEMAKIIEDSVPDGSIIAIHNDELSTSIVAYLYESDKNLVLWDIDNGCEYRIHKWGKINLRDIPDGQLYGTICEDCKEYRNVFFVDGTSAPEHDNFSEENMELIGKNSSTNKWKEYYWLYRVNCF